MPLAFIFGPPAVGKMSVGHELEKLTGFRLFHNHMTIDMVKQVLDVFDPVFGKLVEDLRIRILTALAQSQRKGVIFTAGLDFDEEDNMDFVNTIEAIFTRLHQEVYYLELIAPLEVRLERNKTPHRLEHKPTKRDLKASEEIVLKYDKTSRFNSYPGEFTKRNYLRVDNTDISPDNVAAMFVEKFHLA